MVFPWFSLVFPGKSKKFPDPGRNLSLSYHTAAPYSMNSQFDELFRKFGGYVWRRLRLFRGLVGRFWEEIRRSFVGNVQNKFTIQEISRKTVLNSIKYGAAV